MPLARLAGVAAVALAAAGALPALAAESGESGGVFAGDVGNALWSIVIFVLLLVVLGRYAWGPILKMLQSREAFIREALETARRDREAAEARLREYEEKLAAARVEATVIVEVGRKDSAALAQRIQEEARREAERMLARARQEINLAKAAAVKELYDLAAKLSTELAARIIGRELKAQDHERLIQESIAEIGAIQGGEGAGEENHGVER